MYGPFVATATPLEVPFPEVTIQPGEAVVLTASPSFRFGSEMIAAQCVDGVDGLWLTGVSFGQDVKICEQIPLQLVVPAQVGTCLETESIAICIANRSITPRRVALVFRGHGVL